MADVYTGDAGILRLDVGEASYDVGANTSLVAYNLWLLERYEYNFSSNGGTGYSVGWNGVEYWASGTFAWSWTGAGIQNTLIVSSSRTVPHDADGTKTINVFGHMDATGTAGAGGPADVNVWITLTPLTLAPNIPYSVVASRVSDTQVNLTWGQSNGARSMPTNVDVQRRINGGAWATVASLGNTNSVTVSAAADQKLEYRVAAGNYGGWSAYALSNVLYTTPDAPSSVAATKTGANIVVTFAENVDFSEYTHEVWHGTVTGGVTTWDGAALTTLATGVLTYTHVAPSAALVHVYRVRAVNSVGGLASAYVQSNSVQLQIAPDKPITTAMSPYADKAAILPFAWTHNPIDTTAQTAYQFQRSINGGTTWVTDSGKVVSAAQVFNVPASAYAANTALTTRVRTWGAATTGGSDGTGASPWSDLRTVTYKTIPTTAVTAPANASTLATSQILGTASFAQAEGAVFVKAQWEVLQGATLKETKESTNRVLEPMATVAQNALPYTLRARVQDSNGLWSAWATSTFNVTYTAPPPAVVTTVYIPATGYGQINVTVPAPGGGQSTATLVSVTRTINGVTENIVVDYAAAATLTFIDTTPIINGTNIYTVTTKSALGATATATANLVTAELQKAFLSKGAAFDQVVVFGANLEVGDSVGVASATIEAAGRLKPIGLYGVETSLQTKVKSDIFVREGFSTLEQLRAIFLVPGKACYRDASGRRVFGSAKGSVSYRTGLKGDLSFTMTETS